jgi:hypothetical protein
LLMMHSMYHLPYMCFKIFKNWYYLKEQVLTLCCSLCRNKAGDLYSSYHDYSVTQHDVLRDLALHMSGRDPLNKQRRLVMPRREETLPRDWQRNKDTPFEAQIVSIHTGTTLVLYCSLLFTFLDIYCQQFIIQHLY